MYEIDNISDFSFEEFVAFMFDREISPENNHRPWYFEAAVTVNVERLCSHYLQLFLAPQFLIERFSKEQLEQGFWAVKSCCLDCSVQRLVLENDLPFDSRAELVRSMFVLYRDLFANEALDTSVYMWWDAFCYDWHCGNKDRTDGGEDLLMQDVMFETLSEILAIESEICQSAALHGLSHLHHPGTAKLVENYLLRNPALDEGTKVFAIAAAQFKLM